MKIVTLSDSEFNQFKSWLYQVAGINLSSEKKPLVTNRLGTRVKHYNLSSYGEYFRLISQQSEVKEKQLAIDLLTTNETYFFREPKHFDYLRTQVLPKAPRGIPFRVWCAASSSGEEPYTIAMTLAEGLLSTPWEIVASDISARVLEKARSAQYPMERSKGIPENLLKKYCLKGIGPHEGTFLIESSLSSKVKFMQVNLIENLPALGEFDLVFLRNVMIYFDLETRCQVVARILPLIKPGGHLILSHSENLNGVNAIFKQVVPSIYRKP